LKNIKLKLSKTSLILIATGIFVITVGSLGAIRFQQAGQFDTLEQEIAASRLKLDKLQLTQLTQQKADIEEQLDSNRAEFKATEAKLSETVGSIATGSILFDIAYKHGVDIVEVTSPGISTDDLGGVTSPVLMFNATAEGELSGLIGFISELNVELTTGFVKTANITIPEPGVEEEPPSASIQLILYSDQGDVNG